MVNKIDLAGLDDIAEDIKARFDTLKSEGVDILPMSTLTDEGVMAVKTQVSRLF